MAEENEAFYHAGAYILLDGQQQEDEANRLLRDFKMEESEGGMSALELRLDNWVSHGTTPADMPFRLGGPVKLGQELQLYVVIKNRGVELFQGKITGLEYQFDSTGTPSLTVLAEDALMAARMARRSKTYTNMSVADVARQIAGNLNLQPVIQGLDSPTGVWAQLNESDLAFLRRLVVRFDGDVQVVGKELHVAPRKDVRRGNVELAFPDKLRRVRWVADLSGQVTGVSVRGWNAADGSAVQATISQGANLGPGSGRAGSSYLQSAFASRTEHLGHLAVASDAEARAVAQAAFDLRARRFVRVHGVANGNASLRVGTHVKLKDVGKGFDNTYYVVKTSHVLDNIQGYRTEFVAECAYLEN